MNRIVNPEKVLLLQEKKQEQLRQQQQAQLKTTANAATSSSSFTSAKIYQSTKTGLESMAIGLITSSDRLVTQLGDDVRKNSLNLILLEILFGIMNISVVLLIIYFVIKVLKPIGALTRATSEIKKGNLDVSIQESKGNDELSILSESFNSMV